MLRSLNRFLASRLASSQSITGGNTWVFDRYFKSSVFSGSSLIHSSTRSFSQDHDRKPLFDKILIANRGEIACRVIRTARKLGIKTVAIYSDADRDSMHTKMADEAWHVGPAASAESYLKMDKIIDIAKQSGAQAIHPGYGFLSENAVFAERVASSGLAFIGPPSKAIIDMGSKSASKNIMNKAGVPVVPGYHGENQDPQFLKAKADNMGYPVLIKAVKGGGGKGMRIVEKEQDFQIMLESAKREAIKSFGDDAVLVEKYIVTPRHVEVQVFADTHGNAVYLFERDCSVQRRHQKILEEAPAPGLTPELRASLGEKAVAAAKAVGYVGAGTVEFILDTADNQFYFMEMNTRLQVEHPVSEMITGTDLVQWQLEVASGNRLPRLQHDLQIDGHSFEARIYAENPENNFLPDVGPLIHLRPPDAPDSTVIRIETGVQEGDVVSVHYDPMICKLVVKGRDRDDALRILRKCLDEFQVVGLNTNIKFLKSLASHPSFISGDVETGFIKKHESSLFPLQAHPDPILTAQAAIGLLDQSIQASKRLAQAGVDHHSPWSSLDNFRLNHSFTEHFEFDYSPTVNAKLEKVHVDLEYSSKNGSFDIRVYSKEGHFDHHFTNITVIKSTTGRPTDHVAEINGKRVHFTVVQFKDQVQVLTDGHRLTLNTSAPDYAVNDTATVGDVITPMPCKISQILVAPGQKVEKGQPLIILEAMKMEHVIRSPKDGIIKKILYKQSDIVGEKKKLLLYEDA